MRRVYFEDRTVASFHLRCARNLVFLLPLQCIPVNLKNAVNRAELGRTGVFSVMKNGVGVPDRQL